MSQLGRVAVLVLILATLAWAQERREEFLLKVAPAAKVMEFLVSEYPKVRFQPHDSLNGFYATGSSEDLTKLRGEMPNLDRVPEPSPPVVAGPLFSVNYADFDWTLAMLRRAFPEAVIVGDSRLRLLYVEGVDFDKFETILKLLDKPRVPRE